jgi:hypothetical protein
MKILVSNDTSTLTMLHLPPAHMLPSRGRVFSNKSDQLFKDRLTFYFNNCPEVPDMPCVISIFEEPEKFVKDVRSISMETLQDVSIGAHRYDPDFPSRKQFHPFSVCPFLHRYTIALLLDELVCNTTTAALRKSIFENIYTERMTSSVLTGSFTYQHNMVLHGYIMGVINRLFSLYRFVTNETPFIIRPEEIDPWGEDMRYVSDSMLADYITRLHSQTEEQIQQTNVHHVHVHDTYHIHSIEEMVAYRQAMSYAPQKLRHAHAVLFAYCIQKWCELAIHKYYFDPEFYKKIRPDEDPKYILNYVVDIVIRIESIMLYVLHQGKETASERIALNAVAPEEGPSIQTVSGHVKGQTATFRQGTSGISDIRMLIDKAGF